MVSITCAKHFNHYYFHDPCIASKCFEAAMCLFLRQQCNLPSPIWCLVHLGCAIAMEYFTNCNSPPPSAAYMRRWIGSVLVEKITCCIFGTKPLSEPMFDYYQMDHQEQNWVTYIQDTQLFFQGNVSENIVCEMATFLFRRDELKLTKIKEPMLNYCPWFGGGQDPELSQLTSTPGGLITPYSDTERGQHWLR